MLQNAAEFPKWKSWFLDFPPNPIADFRISQFYKNAKLFALRVAQRNRKIVKSRFFPTTTLFSKIGKSCFLFIILPTVKSDANIFSTNLQELGTLLIGICKNIWKNLEAQSSHAAEYNIKNGSKMFASDSQEVGKQLIVFCKNIWN